jgi:hypothetical protein
MARSFTRYVLDLRVHDGEEVQERAEVVDRDPRTDPPVPPARR